MKDIIWFSFPQFQTNTNMDRVLPGESKMEDHCWEWKLSEQGMSSMKLPSLDCNDQQRLLKWLYFKETSWWSLDISVKIYNVIHIYVCIYACLHIQMYYDYRFKVKRVAKQSLGVSGCYRNIALHTGPHLKWGNPSRDGPGECQLISTVQKNQKEAKKLNRG